MAFGDISAVNHLPYEFVQAGGYIGPTFTAVFFFENVFWRVVIPLVYGRPSVNIMASLVPDVAPPTRAPGVALFVESRMRNILSAFSAKIPLPAVEVIEDSSDRYRFKVYHGFHRYYPSAAAGFSHLPVTVTGPAW
jgi:hypothetical protein